MIHCLLIKRSQVRSHITPLRKETDVELWHSAKAIAGKYHGDENDEDDDGLHVPVEVINEVSHSWKHQLKLIS